MVPPFVGLAVKITDVPLQTVVTGVVITILTGFTVFSIIVIVFEVAGLPVGQAIFEFITQVTRSPLDGIYDIVGAYCDTPTPFTNQL